MLCETKLVQFPPIPRKLPKIGFCPNAYFFAYMTALSLKYGLVTNISTPLTLDTLVIYAARWPFVTASLNLIIIKHYIYLNNHSFLKEFLKMRQLRKILGALLVLTLTVCSIVSCDLIGGNKPEKLTAAADETLTITPHTVEMLLKYDSDDADMLTAMSDLAATEMKLTVDGDNFVGKLALGEENYIIYTFVDGTLYTVWSENGATVQEKEEITSETKTALLNDFGTGLKYTDFSEVEVVSAKGVSVISCKNINSDKVAELAAPLQAQLDEVFDDVVVTVYNATLDMEIENDAYNVIILKCEYFITVNGNQSYSVEMTYSMKYTYGKDREIMAPSF